MWKYLKIIAMIPKEFTIAGGKKIVVNVEDLIKNSGDYVFGDFNTASNVIRIAEKVKIDDEDIKQTDEDLERTFYHELIHSFQFYAGMELDEMVAQTFSNFLYEYVKSKKGC